MNMDRETILIVEENQTWREGLFEILEASGYRVLTASNGLEALQRMESVTPDLIVADLSLPVMDGSVFFTEVRQRTSSMDIPFIFLTTREDRETIVVGEDLEAEGILVKPVSVEELITAVGSRLVRARQLRLVQLQRSYEATLAALANAIDRRDRLDRGHIERVTGYAQVLACRLGWPERVREQLRLSSILHDVGKAHLPEAILLKKEPLTEEEWAEVRRHPLAGVEMISEIPYLATALPVIRHHHERWDGRGYPDGLAGPEIPPMARVVAVADGFDTMTTDQRYSPPYPPAEAYREVIACSGSQYDPEVVAAFVEAWENGEIQAVSRAWESLQPREFRQTSS